MSRPLAYIYVLGSCEDDRGQQGVKIHIFQQDTGACMNSIDLSDDMSFTQLRLTGSEVNRQLLVILFRILC